MSWNKAIINQKLQKHHEDFDSLINELPDELFDFNTESTWTSGQIQNHLILSIKPVKLILKLPKFLLKYYYGQSNRKSRTYDELVTRYLKALDGRKAKAPKQFSPKRIGASKRKQNSKKFHKAFVGLIKATNRWKESDLDLYIIPHPLLGKLTLREILYFSIFHVQHHKKQVETIEKRVNN